MRIEELKTRIESGTINKEFMIFECPENNFLAWQYARAIAKLLSCSIEVIEEQPVESRAVDIFGMEESADIQVYETNNLDELNVAKEGLFIFAKKIDPELRAMYAEYITKMPKLEMWQIIDYARAFLPGLTEDEVTELCNACRYVPVGTTTPVPSIDRVQREIERLAPFNPKEQKVIFEQCKQDGVFGDLSSNSVFEITNAIIKRDVKSLTTLYKRIPYMDVEPLGIITTLYKQFKNIINVQLDPRTTAQKCGMSDKQFYAVKKFNCGYYTEKQLVRIFELLTDVDRRIKTGEFFISAQTADLQFIDYIITHIFVII